MHVTAATKPRTLAELRRKAGNPRPSSKKFTITSCACWPTAKNCSPASSATTAPSFPKSTSRFWLSTTCSFWVRKARRKAASCALLVRFLDEEIPYIDIPEAPLHDDPLNPITSVCRRYVAEHSEDEVPIGWWQREDRYAERLARAPNSPTSLAKSIRPNLQAARA